MELRRGRGVWVADTMVSLPCFFPSVSSVKTNLMPIDYVELLAAVGHPLFLVSAYDVAHCSPDHLCRMNAALEESKDKGAVALLDSGNYESYWREDTDWTPAEFHRIAGSIHNHLCFCYDNQNPPGTSEAIAEDVVSCSTRDSGYAMGTVVPIVHGESTLLPDATRRTAEQLYPLLLSVPERELGEGILKRIRTVRRIREALDTLGVYLPLHLLGTGNPLSIAAYALAGADSFDGLEWCQTVVDHQTGRLLHFQHWDLVRHQTAWGRCLSLPYVQSVLMHNLEFYRKFMEELQEAMDCEDAEGFMRRYATKEQTERLLQASSGDVE